MTTGEQMATSNGGLRPLREIIADLAKPFADRHLKQKALKGTKITFASWYIYVKYLDLYAPGWSGEVRDVTQLGSRVVVTYRITIPCAEGLVWREATGQESDWDEDEETKYGDPSANAEAAAFKRAAAKFSLGLYLYGGGR